MATMQTIYGSHASIAPFRLLRPKSVEDAVRAQRDADDAPFLAGGVDLVPSLRAGRAPSTLVWLGDIAALRQIENGSDRLRIGAGVTYGTLCDDAAVAAALPDLADAWNFVANVRVRQVATVGGNIMSRNPQYDMVPVLLALDARLTFVDRQGSATVTEARCAGLPAGLLTSIDIPHAPSRRLLVERSYKPALSLAVCVAQGPDGFVGRAALGCAHGWPYVATLDLAGTRHWKALADRAEPIAAGFSERLPQPLSDAAASSAYRRELARVLLKRALVSIASREPRS